MTAAGTVGVRGRGAAGSSPPTATAGTPRSRAPAEGGSRVRTAPSRSASSAAARIDSSVILSSRSKRSRSSAASAHRRVATSQPHGRAVVEELEQPSLRRPGGRPGQLGELHLARRLVGLDAARDGGPHRQVEEVQPLPACGIRLVREDDDRRLRSGVDLPRQLRPDGLGAVGGRHPPPVGQGGDDLEPAPGGAALGEVDHRAHQRDHHRQLVGAGVDHVDPHAGPAGRSVTVKAPSCGGPRWRRARTRTARRRR